MNDSFCALFSAPATGSTPAKKAAAPVKQPPKAAAPVKQSKKAAKPKAAQTIAHAKFVSKPAVESPEPAPHDVPDNTTVNDTDPVGDWEDAFEIEEFEEELEEVRDDTSGEEDDDRESYGITSPTLSETAGSPDVQSSPDILQRFRSKTAAERQRPSGPTLAFDDDSHIV